MKLNSLIDPKKKAKVLEAIEKGDGTILKKKKAAAKKPLAEQPTAKKQLTLEERGKLIAELAVAATAGDAVKVWELIRKGVDVNARDEFETPPLNYAAIKGHAEVVDLLIRNGVNVNGRSGDGETALRLATDYMYPQVVELLRRAGARE